MRTILPAYLRLKGIAFGLAACMAVFTFSNVQADNHQYSDSWGKQGLSINQQRSDGLNLNFSIRDFSFENREVNGESMTGISFSESLLQNEAGAPDLPGFSRYIAIPNGATAVVEIVNMRTERFYNIEMAPAPVIPLDTDQSPLHFEKNSEIYAQDAFYPAQPVTLGDFTQIRGVDVAMLGIQPYQYNPVTKELIVYRDLEVNITFEGGSRTFGTDKYRSPWWDELMSDAIFNYQSLPEIDYSQRARSYERSTGYDYLIIVPNDPIFMQWADSIKTFRMEEGIYTGIVALSEIGTNVNPSTLEQYINNAYNTWDIPPTAVLLLGDYGSNNANFITSPIWDGYCVSDNILTDVSGNSMPDIIFARITAQNASQLESMVGRFIKYERTPPTNPTFYARPVTALGWQTERWFQICSEVVGGFWKNTLGKTPVRINEVYQGNPGNIWSTATNTNTVVGVFGPNGLGYIPASPSELGNWRNGNATMINNALNEGSFMLMHRDHGMETGWGEPSYTNSNINGLTNTDLCFVLSINCLTGKYNWNSESFTEKFHRYTYNSQPAGALGLTAASEVSYSFVNDVYVWGLMDNMWPNFMPQYGSTPVERGVLPAFGNAAGKYFLRQSNWPYNTSNKEVTYNLFHHHGDAFLTVCTEVPQTLTAQYEPTIYEGQTEVVITATPSSKVTLTANGQILGTGTTGFINTITITIPPQEVGTRVKVVVTRPNCNRYYGGFEVVPMVTSSVAGEDALICEGLEHQLNGQAVNYIDLLWETSGTGTFNDATILDPIYTPGDEDILAGEVMLSLTALNPDVNDSTDYMMLSIRLAPQVFAGDDNGICADAGYSAVDATAENYTELMWATNGTGTFDDPALVNPRYIPGEEDIDAGMVTLTLTVSNDVCEPVSSEVIVYIRPLPLPVIAGENEVCQFSSGNIYTASTAENAYLWEVTGGTIIEGTQGPSVNVTWDEAGTGMLSMNETNEYGCQAAATFEVMVALAPMPVISGEEVVCANSTGLVYTSAVVEGNIYEWLVTGGEVTEGAGTNSITVNWFGNGSGIVNLVQLDPVSTCSASVEYNVLIDSPEPVLISDTTICINHIITIPAESGYTSYEWSNGETGETLTISGDQQGLNTTTYDLVVTDDKGCQGTASVTVTVEACTGLSEMESQLGISIYPNPNNGEFALEINNAPAGEVNISIVNAVGENVYTGRFVINQTKHQEKFNVNLNSGVYFLKMDTANGKLVRKLIVK